MSRISLRRLSERADLSVPRGSPQMGARYDADAFGRFAEGMARFLGTGRFIVGQTVLVVVWIILNTLGLIKHWDPYPFILLNLAFSTQAAYAAPLILLAQNRQDDRDRANIDRDREVAARTQADTEFLAREIAAVRLALADVVTTQDLEDSLAKLTKLIADQSPQVPPGLRPALAGQPAPDGQPGAAPLPDSLGDACAGRGGGERAGGADGAGHGLGWGQPAQVGEDEQGLGAHDDGQAPLELGQCLGIGPGQRGEGVIDEREPVPGPLGRDAGPGNGRRDHGPDRALPGPDPVEQHLGGVADPFHRVLYVRDRRQRLGGVGPHPHIGFQQQRDQVREVPVGGGLGHQRGPSHRRHGDLRAVAGQVLHGPDNGGAGAGLLVHAARPRRAGFGFDLAHAARAGWARFGFDAGSRGHGSTIRS
jgi:uncharacterized membrane protein